MNLAFRGDADDGRPRLPGSLHVNRRLSQWLSFEADGTVTIRPGKVELGQGILTALAQIAAECGYANAGHFSHRFRDAHGTTPNTYRRAMQGR